MPDQLKIISTFQFSDASLEKLRAAAQGKVVCTANEEEFLALLPEAEILCTYILPTNWRALTPHLRWIQWPGAGVDRLREFGLLDAESGIIITTASGIHTNSISEYVFGSMLMFNRSWPQMVHLQAQHIWGESRKHQLRERVLANHTLGIVGLGSIGRRIAQVGRALNMRILATRFSARPGDLDPDVEELYPITQLHDLLSKCDYVVIAVPLTPRTELLIGEAELRAMQPYAYLVNIARGRVLDERALIQALREGWIAGAGLDVTEQEPLPPDSPLYDLPNVILTPHISGANEQYEERLADLFADNLYRYRTGQSLRNRYDPQRGY